MKLPLNKITTFILSIMLLPSGPAWATNSVESSVDPLMCSPEEVDAIMAEYHNSLGDVDQYHVPRFEEFREVRMAVNAKDPENKGDGLCDVLVDPSFTIPDLDLSAVESSWSSLKALMSGVSAGVGVDWNKIMSEAYDKGLEKSKAFFLSGSCKLAQDFSGAVNESIDDAWEEGKDMAEDEFESNDSLNNVGIDDIDIPLWKQIAEKENEERLGEYADYAKWYEGDFNKENTSDSVDSIVDKILGDNIEKGLDENIQGNSQNKIDTILDSIKPNYGK